VQGENAQMQCRGKHVCDTVRTLKAFCSKDSIYKAKLAWRGVDVQNLARLDMGRDP